MNWDRILTKRLEEFGRQGGIYVDVASENEVYDHIAEHYDETREVIPDSFFDFLVERGIVRRNHVVLDMGCGTGRNSYGFAIKYDIPVVGIDISFSMLQKYHQKLSAAGKEKNAILIKGSAFAVPMISGTADVCTCFALIHLISDYEKVIAEILRILKIDGKFIAGGMEIVPEDMEGNWIGNVWELYYDSLEKQGVVRPSHVGPKGKVFAEYLQNYFSKEILTDPCLRIPAKYSMRGFLFEVSNRTDSNLVSIDPDINHRAVTTLRARLKDIYGPDYEEMVCNFRSQMRINIFTRK